MADKKITGLTANTTPITTDILEIVDDPGGSPDNQKVTLVNLITKAHGLSDSTVVGVASGVLTSGTDVAIADGGTGSSTAAAAIDALGGASSTGSGGLVRKTSAALVTPDLGTPSAGTLTNCTGLPVAGIAASTSTALGVGSIELGHATDTSITRVSAGLVAIEGVNIVTTSATQTLTNKTLTSPTLTTPDIGTPSAGTLTNCTGLPVAGIAASTSTALGVGSIELGHATDTSITRVSAGLVAIEGSNILTAATGQPLDADLTTIAGLTATTNNFMQSKSSAWASRTPTQVTADLDVAVGDGGSGGTKGLVPAPVTGDATKFLRGDMTYQTISGGGDALTTNPLSQFAATTSLQLKGVISDETGSGALVFATTPTLVTPILGTPTSGTLTNCTGLPVAAVVSDTSTALGIGSLEVGHATDTTIARVSAGKISVEGVNVVTTSSTDTLTNKTLTSPTLTTPVLGTPSSGTLTSCTGLPIAGLVASTSTAIGVGSVELGHATDTTLTRVSAGVVAIEGINIDTVSGTQTLTNKRITKRVVTASDATSVTPNSDNADITYQLNTQSAGTLTINADAGTPTNGQAWLFKIKSTNAQTFAWNSVFVGGTVALPTASTAGKIDYYSFMYDTVNSKWDFVGNALGF